MIDNRSDYKYVAGDLFARSAATNDYLTVIDGTSLFTRNNSLVRGEDICWIWECINTRRAALFRGGNPFTSYGMPYQYRRTDGPFAHGDHNVIDNMVSAFNALLASSRNFANDPTRLSQTIWHHQNTVPDEIFLLYPNEFVVSMPQRYSVRHTPFDVWSAIVDMERFVGTLNRCCREEIGSSYTECDWSGFTTNATMTIVGGFVPGDTEATLENRYSRCIQAHCCSGWGNMDGHTDPSYFFANIATTGTIRVILPYLEHVKAVYPIYHLYSKSQYFSSFADGRSAISESGDMSSVVVSTTPRTMDANHIIEITPAQEIAQACPLSNLASEMNLQHGFSQNVPTDELDLEVAWFIRLTNLSLIIELDESVSTY